MWATYPGEDIVRAAAELDAGTVYPTDELESLDVLNESSQDAPPERREDLQDTQPEHRESLQDAQSEQRVGSQDTLPEQRESSRDTQSERFEGARYPYPKARIVGVEAESPADDAGFSPGCYLVSVDGEPLRDIVDWRWLASGDEVTLGYIDLDGDEGEVQLWRDPGQDWGFEFEGLVFDRVRQCRNACTFCFMHQLPRGMRPSLYLRDDDFRLSFLLGTFVTCTNLTPEDERRICEQRISPLRVSLQASNPAVRRRLIGRHAQHGMDALERLLAAGIEFHAQIVLVPGENDGAVLEETLNWAYGHPGILGIGIVPLGFTRHQRRFAGSFNAPGASRTVIDLIAPFQDRAQRERGTAWVFAADEFYRNAWGADLLEHLPPASFYGDFSMFEDGIGIIRSTVDDWEAAQREGLVERAADMLRRTETEARMVVGCAQREFLEPLVARAGIGDVFRPLYVRNDFFGGNVDVTGLLTAQDIASAITRSRERKANAEPVDSRSNREPVSPGENGRARDGGCMCDWGPGSSGGRVLYLVPRVVFNDDGLTLDDATLDDMMVRAGTALHVVSCSPREYFSEIMALISDLE